MMTFREAMVELKASEGLPEGSKKKLDKFISSADKHPRLWKIAENACAHVYERRTGETLVKGKIDWSKILQWLKDNAPLIIRTILGLLGLFA